MYSLTPPPNNPLQFGCIKLQHFSPLRVHSAVDVTCFYSSNVPRPTRDDTRTTSANDKLSTSLHHTVIIRVVCPVLRRQTRCRPSQTKREREEGGCSPSSVQENFHSNVLFLLLRILLQLFVLLHAQRRRILCR